MKLEDLISRREFMKDLGLAGTFVLVASTGGCEQLIEIIENRPTRRNIANMTASDPTVVAYKAAVSAMKAMDVSAPSDGRGWTKQAQIHNNHCPHGNWYFLPWHRAYLVYFERICRKLSGVDSFALPFWNWTSNPTIPSVFWGDSSNPLFDSTRTIGPSDAIPPEFVGPAVMEGILNEPNFFLFASSQAVGQRDRTGTGVLEGTPHNNVHSIISGDMGTFMSPLDAVFWTHHCMVDACWVEWNITRGNPNTDNSSWYNFPLVDFVDENNTPVNIPIVDTMLMPILSYQYEHTQMGTHASLLPPAGLPASNVLEAALRGGLPLAMAYAVSAFAAFQQPSATPRHLSKSETKALEKFLRKGAPVKLAFTNRYELARTMTVQVGRPASASIKIETAKVRPALDVQTRNRAYVTVSGITMPEHADHFVRVFVNKPDASAATPISDPHYAGSFGFFGGSHGGSAGMDKAGFVVDATEALRRISQTQGFSDQVDVGLVAVPYEHHAAQGQGFSLEKIELGIAPPPNVQKFQLNR
jgi:tyrosinase